MPDAFFGWASGNALACPMLVGAQRRSVLHSDGPFSMVVYPQRSPVLVPYPVRDPHREAFHYCPFFGRRGV